MSEHLVDLPATARPRIAVATVTPAAAIVATVTDANPTCWRCKRILAWRATRPWEIRCSRCKAENCNPLS
jgi:hypothetical protein